MPEPSLSENDSFHELFAQAVAQRNLTLERLSHRLRQAGLPVSIATLSYWQTGRSLPTRARSVQAVVELEKILRVPPGHLTGALPGDLEPPWNPFERMAEHDQVAAALGELAVPHDSLVVHDHVTVSADGNQQHQVTRHVFEALGDGMDRFQLAWRSFEPHKPPPLVDALVGVELGREVHLPETGLYSVEMLLPRKLAMGELVMVEYAVTFDTTDAEERGVGRAISSHVQYAIFDASFEGDLPRAAEYYSIPNSTDDHAEEQRTEVSLQPAPSLQRVLLDPVPGVHGLSWRY